jgi:amino acid adenylation domain-containing protein
MSTDIKTTKTSTLSTDQLELLNYLPAVDDNSDSQVSRIVPRIQRQQAPLSFAQQRLWFLDQLEPDSSFYNFPWAIRLKGFIKIDALRKTLNVLVARHETLRTTFAQINGEPVQLIAMERDQELQIIDLKNLAEDDREAEAKRLAVAESRRPFDLSKGPLLRVSLIQLGAEEYILIITKHYIISDEWSMGILWREVATLYKSFAWEAEASLPKLPIQYADFALWQREWLQGKVLEDQLAYWKRQLASAPPLLDLPLDRPRPGVQTHRGQRKRFVISKEVTVELKKLSQQEGVTLFMTLLAAFEVLLAKYSRQDDIVVGSPVANRNRMEIKDLVGFFVNTLVLRTNLSGNPTFRELLQRVKETCLEAYAHRDLPFEKLVEELHPARNLSYSPLFQVLFALQSAQESQMDLDGIQIQPFDSVPDVAKFDLSLSFQELEVGLGGSIEYSVDLFDDSTIDRMVGHIETLFGAILAKPEQRVSELPLLTEIERRQLLVEWNDTDRDYPQDKCIHQLFEMQVDRTPDLVAVEFEGTKLTYRELNQRANQLAHYLTKLGVKPEKFVGICMARSVEMVIAVLGTLKAGGGYVPLDPEYPAERRRFMLEDSQATILLTQQALAVKVFEQQEAMVRVQIEASIPVQTICLDTNWETITQESSDNLANLATPYRPAYVIFTSGSTGKPKGVVMEHRPLCNLISWQIETTLSSKTARTLQFASLGFDVSFQELFSTWCSGGTLVLLPTEVRRDPTALLRFVAINKVERLFLPVVALQQLADAAEIETVFPEELREIITAGEQLQTTPRIVSLFERLKFCRLVNQYGPTECHVVSACTLEPAPRNWPLRPPIGRPISNIKLYLLDVHLQPVPIGIAGELFIGGDGLARGYLNRPELTAEKFIGNPLSIEPEARLYKTGDLARYLPDGSIEFLGRIDNQVKIRGSRIELGEIEAVLSKHPLVRESVVILREDTLGDKRIVGYVVSSQPTGPNVHELRSYLKGKLPEYMVPSAFVFLERLPLTPNGKVDRRALPQPGDERPELERAFLAPQDGLQRELAKIWERVLGVRPIGIADNFFDLGGHSLLAVKLIAEIEKKFTKRVAPATLFQSPTILELAEIIRRGPASWSSLVRVQPGGTRTPFFWILGDLSNAFLPRYLDSDQPLYGLEHQSQDGKPAGYTSVETIAAHYLGEMRRVQAQGPYYLGGYSFGSVVALEVAQQLKDQAEEVSLLVLLDPPGPLSGTSRSSTIPLKGGRTIIDRFHDRIHRHYVNLARLGYEERLAYFWERGVAKVDEVRTRITTRITKTLKRGLSKACLVLGRELPPSVRSLYILDIYDQALRKYEMRPYSGRVVLLKGEGQSDDYEGNWEQYLVGEKQLYEVPGNHLDLRQEAYIPSWAEKLKVCLEAAQATDVANSGIRDIPQKRSSFDLLAAWLYSLYFVLA